MSKKNKTKNSGRVIFQRGDTGLGYDFATKDDAISIFNTYQQIEETSKSLFSQTGRCLQNLDIEVFYFKKTHKKVKYNYIPDLDIRKPVGSLNIANFNIKNDYHRIYYYFQWLNDRLEAITSLYKEGGYKKDNYILEDLILRTGDIYRDLDNRAIMSAWREYTKVLNARMKIANEKGAPLSEAIWGTLNKTKQKKLAKGFERKKMPANKNAIIHGSSYESIVECIKDWPKAISDKVKGITTRWKLVNHVKAGKLKCYFDETKEHYWLYAKQ